MELSDACDAIAQMVRDEQAVMIHPGIRVMRFIEYLEQGETPAMAVSLVKRELPLSEIE